MKKLFGAALIFFVLGASLFAAGAFMAHGDLSVMDIDTELVHIRFDRTHGADETEYTYPAGDVQRIAIDTVSADVRVGTTDGGLIRVISGAGADVEFSPPVNGTLTVRQKEKPGFWLFSIDLTGDGDVTVLIPDSVMAPGLTVTTISGDVRLDAATLGGVRLGTTSGDVDVPSLACGDFSVETVSGEVELGTLQAREVSVSTTSGDVDFDLVGALDAVRFSSTSGDIGGVLAGGREDYRVDVSTVSGDCSLRPGGEGDVDLGVKTVSGDIDIGFETR